MLLLLSDVWNILTLDKKTLTSHLTVLFLVWLPTWQNQNSCCQRRFVTKQPSQMNELYFNTFFTNQLKSEALLNCYSFPVIYEYSKNSFYSGLCAHLQQDPEGDSETWGSQHTCCHTFSCMHTHTYTYTHTSTMMWVSGPFKMPTCALLYQLLWSTVAWCSAVSLQ